MFYQNSCEMMLLFPFSTKVSDEIKLVISFLLVKMENGKIKGLRKIKKKKNCVNFTILNFGIMCEWTSSSSLCQFA